MVGSESLGARIKIADRESLSARIKITGRGLLVYQDPDSWRITTGYHKSRYGPEIY
jgi:hypothetical protein